MSNEQIHQGRWLDNEPVEKPKVSFLEPPEAKQVFDKEMVMEQYGGDETFLRELLNMFLDDAPIKIEKIQDHLKEEDLAGLEFQAHSLTGAASHIGGKALQEVALEIEVAARSHELDRARGLVAKIQREFERFKRVLYDSEVLKSR